MVVTNGNAEKTFSVVKSLATATTSAARAENMAFPFVSLPDFSLRAHEYQTLSGAEYLSWVPLVSAADKAAWEAYSVEHQDWIIQGASALHLKDVGTSPIPSKMYDHVYTDGHIENLPDLGVYAPIWEVYPVPKNNDIINQDIMSIGIIREVLTNVIESKSVMISGVQFSNFIFRFSNPDDYYPPAARSYVIEPVLESFEDNAPIVGFIIAKIPWDAYFKDVLPRNVNGIAVNVVNSCNQSFTYILNGPEPGFLGDGVYSDTHYKDLAITGEFASFARLDDASLGGCEYTLYVYPTSEFEDAHSSNKPFYHTFSVVLVFVFTAMVFVLYDFMVTRRQNVILATAHRATTIVQSLFPKNVQKRIMEEAKTSAEANKKRKGHTFVAKSQIRDFLADDAEKHTTPRDFSQSKPIADLFPVSLS
jgi:hypothetical protein